MFPNLLGQKAAHHLSDQDMASIINVSRNSYMQKMKSGRFWPSECRAYCEYFGKSFGYLFATNDEIE